MRPKSAPHFLWLAAASLVGLSLLACSRAADPDPAAAGFKRQSAKSTPSGGDGVGINLGTWANYTPDLGTIDQLKRASPWLTQCDSWRPECKGFAPGGSAWDTLEEGQLELDAEGWVRRMPTADDPKVRFRKVSMALYAAGSPQAGEFVVRYVGRGKLTYGLAARKLESRSSPGRDVIDVVSQVGVPLLIELRETDPKDPLRLIRVFPPGGACAGRLAQFVATAAECPRKDFVPFEHFPETQRWHPHFVSDLKGFRTLRFMDWNNTNRLRPTPWAQRPQLTDPTWATENGPPYEAMFDLARETGADPWINLPTQSTDEDARAFARLAKVLLAPGETLNLEYSNEPWNFAFPAAAWMRSQGQARWPEAAARGGDTTALLINWYAQRSIELCRLVKTEFATEAGRVRCILNSQAANPAFTEMMLACPLAARRLGQPCSQHVDAIAIAPYFGHYLSVPRVQAVVQGWMDEPDHGLSALFAELSGEDAAGQTTAPPLASVGSGAPRGALALTRGWMEASLAVAKRHGLPLWAYEGGQHLTPPQSDPGDRWQALMARANRDPRMGQAQSRSLQDWRALGGQTYVFYNYLGAYSRYGFWGQKEKPLDDTAAKWQALVRERDRQEVPSH